MRTPSQWGPMSIHDRDYSKNNPLEARDRAAPANPASSVVAEIPSSRVDLDPWSGSAGIDDHTGRFELEDIQLMYQRDRTLLVRAQAQVSAWSAQDRESPQFSESGAITLANVTGSYIGEKYRFGAPTGDLAVVVTVTRKASIHNIDPRARIPPIIVVNGQEVLTDVVEDGRAEFAVQCGSLMGVLNSAGSGTMGAIVQRTKSVTRYVLSNSHVLSNFGAIPVGTKFYSGGSHVCTSSINIALQKWNPNFPSGYNIVDAGLATATANAVSTFKGIPGAINPSPATLGLNASMKMSGGTSGVRQGVVVGVNAEKDFSFNGSIYKFKFCYVLKGTDGKNNNVLALPGDSGSLVLSATLRPVGVIIGSASLSYACTVGNVMQKLSIAKFIP